jgi:hypothetical protein
MDDHVKRRESKGKKKKKPFAYSVIYTYYRELLQMPDIKP